MRWQFVAWHHAAVDGTAAGRQLWAVGEALRAQGHEVAAWSWSPNAPQSAIADWCEWRPLPDEPKWRTRARAIVRPRSDIVRARWPVPEADVLVADDPASWPAIAGAHTGVRVATIHYSVALDRAALRAREAALVQNRRGERRAVARADQTWTLSDRVARAVGRGLVMTPTIPLPEREVPFVEEPVAGLLADWTWPPNVAAAVSLLREWPTVRGRVPGARLLLAGRGPSPVGAATGVEWLGEVPRTADLLAQLAVFAFPCPDTSGPKMKVLDAMAHGVPVVTTPAGVEGIVDGERNAGVAAGPALAARLAELLADPAARARLRSSARAAVVTSHAPDVAASRRVDAVAGTS